MLEKISDEKYYTTEEVAKMLHVSIYTVKSWRTRKKYSLAYYRIGGSVRYLGEDLRHWLESMHD